MIRPSGCPDDASWIAFGEGDRLGPDDEALREHARSCEHCQLLLLALDPTSEHWFSANAASSELPIRIGRYEVLGRLGAGAMGIVYEAYDPQLDRNVAVKVLSGSGREERCDLTHRLHREARAMAQLSHPNVVTVHDIGAVG